MKLIKNLPVFMGMLLCFLWNSSVSSASSLDDSIDKCVSILCSHKPGAKVHSKSDGETLRQHALTLLDGMAVVKTLPGNRLSSVIKMTYPMEFEILNECGICAGAFGALVELIDSNSQSWIPFRTSVNWRNQVERIRESLN